MARQSIPPLTQADLARLKAKGITFTDTQAGTSGLPQTAPIYPTEKAFQSGVVQLAIRCGWMVYHTYDSRRCVPGFPDLILLRGNRQVVAELKIEPNKPTESQREWLAAFAATGAETFIWYPSDWELIVATLGRAEK